ncbi:MAG: hypothetical protein ACFCVE_14305 [Phycisphaerae bacterium]
MKKSLALACLSVAALALTGCQSDYDVYGSTPAYSLNERMQQISRNQNMEGRMRQDDIDSALLLRPVSMMTTWKVRRF